MCNTWFFYNWNIILEGKEVLGLQGLWFDFHLKLDEKPTVASGRLIEALGRKW